MRNKWQILRIFLLLILTVVLYSFSNKRNQQRNVKDALVVFTNPEQLYISMGAIYSMLTQDLDTIDFKVQEISIKRMEEEILKHPMVADAEVFMTLDGILSAEVTQRTPIGRCVNKDGVQYLDQVGVFMPLSSNYSARVPLLYGIEDSISVKNIMPLLWAIQEDEFMKQSVVSIIQNDRGCVNLQIRQNNLEILFGEVKELDNKFRKLKGFIKYTRDEKTLENYKTINLEYEGQVVATKK